MDGWRRREFLRKLARLPLLAGLGVLVASCGGGGGGSGSYGGGGSGGSGGGGCDGESPMIAGNHGHTACLTMAQLNAGQPVVVTLTMGNGHTHTVSLNGMQVTSIKNGNTEAVTSSFNAGHNHVVTFSLAS